MWRAFEQAGNVYNQLCRTVYLVKLGSRKNVRYAIRDNFLNFWFKYVERNRSYIELQNYDDLLSLLMADSSLFEPLAYMNIHPLCATITLCRTCLPFIVVA